MPLHRDIHWIGRQWAVTGHGVQLIDQKLQGFFDVEASKVWNDALIDSMYAKDWLNAADFEKAIAVARARYPQPDTAPQPAIAAMPRREVAPPPPATPPPPPVEPVASPPPVAKPAQAEAPKPAPPVQPEPPPAVAVSPAPVITTPVEPPSSRPQAFEMQCDGRARFLRPWRVVARKI